MTTQHPKADANGWIKFSDSKPEIGQKYIGVARDTQVVLFFTKHGIPCDLTHWRPYDLPPPVAEKSQREIDDEQCEIWMSHAIKNGVFSANPIWHAALEWERTRNRNEKQQ